MKKPEEISRVAMTKDELRRLSIDEIIRIKFTEEERQLRREINDELEFERSKRVERIHAEQESLLAEIQAAGLKIRFVSDLISMSARYERAIPILLKHLQMEYSDVTKETIARALAVPEPEVQKAWPMLVEQYKKAPTGQGLKAPGDTKEYRLSAKNGLACTLSVAVTEATMGELVELLKDPANGESRILMLSAIRRSTNPIAKQAREELAMDPELSREIASWKRK